MSAYRTRASSGVPNSRPRAWRPGLAVMFACLIMAPSFGQDAAKPADSGAAPPAPAAPAKKPAVRNLDDLLGLPQDKPAPKEPEGPALPPDGADPADLDKDRADLERKLTNAEIADRFRDAVRQMGESADRIAKGNDIGLVTQRLQEEIIKKLDLIVQQSQNQDSNSSSSSSDQQSNQQQDPGRQRGGKPQQGQQSPQNQAGQGENKGEAMPPPGQDPQFKGRLDTARAAWGNLPERVREALLQGSSDQFSSLYEAMTEAYYRKLAEEAQQ
jgi:hypothetical protein